MVDPEWTALRRVTVLTPEAALMDLRSTAEGLSGDEAAARLARTGPNELPKERGPGRPPPCRASPGHEVERLPRVGSRRGRLPVR